MSNGSKGTVKIGFSRSAYISGIETRTREKVTSDVEVTETDGRYLQRVFSTDRFYGKGRPRFETIMIQARMRTIDSVTYNNLYFAKAFCFHSMKQNDMMRQNNDICMVHNKENCETCQFNMDDHYIFVLYYEIFGERYVSKYGEDRKLLIILFYIRTSCR